MYNSFLSSNHANLKEVYSKLCKKYPRHLIDDVVNDLLNSKANPETHKTYSKCDVTDTESCKIRYWGLYEQATSLMPNQIASNLKVALVHLDLINFNVHLAKEIGGEWILDELKNRIFDNYKHKYVDYQGNSWDIKPVVKTFMKIPISDKVDPKMLKPFADSYYIAISLTLAAGMYSLSKVLFPLAELVIIEPVFVQAFNELQPTITELIAAAQMIARYDDFDLNKLNSNLIYEGDTSEEVKDNIHKYGRDLMSYGQNLHNAIIRLREFKLNQYTLIKQLPSELTFYLHFNTNKINYQRLEYLDDPIKALGKGYLGLKKALKIDTSNFYAKFIMYSLFQTKDKVDKFSKLVNQNVDRQTEFINYFSDAGILSVKLSDDPIVNYKLGQILLKYPNLLSFPNHKYLVIAADEIGLDSMYNLKEYAYKLMYSDLDIRDDFEKQIFEKAQEYGYSMKSTDYAIHAYRMRKEESYLDGIEVTYDKYKLTKMLVDDVRTYFAGEYTNCCYTFDSAAKTCIYHAITNPNSDTYELIDTETNNVLLNIWVYVTTDDVVVIDSVESKYNNIDPEALFEIFIDFVNQIKDNGFDDVRISQATYGITPIVVELLQTTFDLIPSEEIAYLDESEGIRYYDSRAGQFIIKNKGEI